MQRVATFPCNSYIRHRVSNISWGQIRSHPILRLQRFINNPPKHPLSNLPQTVLNLALALMQQAAGNHRVIQRSQHLHPRCHQTLDIESEVVPINI